MSVTRRCAIRLSVYDRERYVVDADLSWDGGWFTDTLVLAKTWSRPIYATRWIRDREDTIASFKPEIVAVFCERQNGGWVPRETARTA